MDSNRLASARSPYLLQHAGNPVDWFEWGEEAFELARARDKPIFLSVGYSTCHWCHVMERESFEDAATADILNQHFVAIKVDREERPDVDRLYMTFVQAATGSGGWPMSVFLTPDLKPFYGGTYFPPRSAWGRPGFPDLLRALAEAWHRDRANIENAAASALDSLREVASVGFGRAAGAGPGRGTELDLETLARAAFTQLENSYEPLRVGFGGPPKFPRPVAHDFLAFFHVVTGDEGARAMSERTLEAMITRGMNDQLGGGFHRYSVDGDWIVPHFEKMLYDQAQLVVACLEAFGISGREFFAYAARRTLEYVRRDLTHLDGGFFCAEDADSLAEADADHKVEGAFYVWRKAEIDALLSGADAALFRDFYGVRDRGNAPHEGDPHGEFAGQNILFEALPLAQAARQNGLKAAQASERLEVARGVLFVERAKRPRPHRDEKILVSWNGLMISACARAGAMLDEPKWTRAALGAARWIESELWDAPARLLRRHWKEGASEVNGFADDYAALARAHLDLYDATFDTSHLARAQTLLEALDEHFWDEEGGGWWNAPSDPRLPVRFKEDYDGAEPAAASLAVEACARLFHLTGDDKWHDRARSAIASLAPRLEVIPSAMPLLLRAAMSLESAPVHIVIAGEAGPSAPLLRVARQGFDPRRHIILLDQAGRDFWNRDFLRAMTAKNDEPTAYVCRDFACQNPVTDPEELRALLK